VVDADELVRATFRVLDLAGVLANAVLGGVLARRERLDPVGFVVLAILSGLGGGIIRDTLLAHGPPIALTDPVYIVVAVVGALVACVLPVGGTLWRRCFPVVDALAVGCWAAVGAQKTLALGLGGLAAVLLGTVTAVGGSAVRDVVLRQIPGIFGGRTLYATSAGFASAVMVGFAALGLSTVGLIVSTVVGAGLTLLASARGWELREAYELRPRELLRRR
jgi:uncharacterized membrane protein YeiH